MGMLLVGGAQVRHIVALTLVGIVGVGMVLNSGMLEKFQQCRLTSFLETQDQECAERGAEYNLEQAKTAIGSGGLTGSGPFNGTQTRLDIVPEQHTDFIFTAVGEELGLHRRRHPARAAVDHRLAGVAHRPARARPARHPHLRRACCRCSCSRCSRTSG